MKYCVLLSDERQPAKIWRIVQETPRFLVLEYDVGKIIRRLTVSPNDVWRLT